MIPYQKANVSFKKLEDIGQAGQNSNVYKIHDEYLNAKMVIKEISKGASGFSPDDYFLESSILYKSSHPNIVQVHYACQDNDNIYIAMPFYKNGSLEDLMKNRFLTVKEIIKYSTHVLSGLHNIHSKNLIHFDIKPNNILISDRYEALLSDFGLARPVSSDGFSVKTPFFYNPHRPPEAFVNQEKKYDLTFDIYQIGLTMYRMCVGNDEFNKQISSWGTWEDLYSAILAQKFPNRESYPLHIPKKLQKIINKCLLPECSQRFNSAIQIVNAFADIGGNILDWQFKVIDDDLVWEQNKDGTIKTLRVSPQMKSYAYNCNVNDLSKQRRITHYCKQTITNEEIINFLMQ